MIDSPDIHVVDDDSAVRESLCMLLQMHGCHVQVYASAEEFLSAVDLNRAGVLITDLDMPGMSGQELQQRLIAAQSPLSVVIVSGVANVKIAVGIMEKGAVTLLEKPFSESDLIAAMQLGRDRSHCSFQQRAEQQALGHKLSSLSDDDRAILQGMITGKPIKACSLALSLSTRTVERRRAEILKTLGAESIPELATMIASVWPLRPPFGTASHV